MGIAAVKLRIMPSSPDVDMEELTQIVTGLLESHGAKNPSISIEPIAFGLKALIPFFAWDESKELEPLQAQLSELENVNSVEVTDMRRAFG